MITQVRSKERQKQAAPRGRTKEGPSVWLLLLTLVVLVGSVFTWLSNNRLYATLSANDYSIAEVLVENNNRLNRENKELKAKLNDLKHRANGELPYVVEGRQ